MGVRGIGSGGVLLGRLLGAIVAVAMPTSSAQTMRMTVLQLNAHSDRVGERNWKRYHKYLICLKMLQAILCRFCAATAPAPKNPSPDRGHVSLSWPQYENKNAPKMFLFFCVFSLLENGETGRAFPTVCGQRFCIVWHFISAF